MRLKLLVITAVAATSLAAAPQKQKPVEPPPIVRTNIAPPPVIQQVREAPPPVITPQARAAEWRYSYWKAYDFGSFTMATTVNESSSAFGIACGNECVWFINFGIECDDGHEYPAMINSPAGSYAIELRCFHLDKRAMLAFPLDDYSVEMLVKKGEAGFAIPLESGKFQVSRFSLSGGAEAVKKAMEIAVQRQNQKQQGLRDFKI